MKTYDYPTEINHFRGSGRKISKGGQKHVRRHLGGGGGDMRIVSSFHFEGLKSPRRHKAIVIPPRFI